MGEECVFSGLNNRRRKNGTMVATLLVMAALATKHARRDPRESNSDRPVTTDSIANCINMGSLTGGGWNLWHKAFGLIDSGET